MTAAADTTLTWDRRLADRGVSFAGPPHAVHREPGRELRMAFKDSEANPLALMAWVPEA